MPVDIDIYRDNQFLLKPHYHYGKYDNPEQARYFGHTWFLCLYWLGWEVQILGRSKAEAGK